MLKICVALAGVLLLVAVLTLSIIRSSMPGIDSLFAFGFLPILPMATTIWIIAVCAIALTRKPRRFLKSKTEKATAVLLALSIAILVTGAPLEVRFTLQEEHLETRVPEAVDTYQGDRKVPEGTFLATGSYCGWFNSVRANRAPSAIDGEAVFAVRQLRPDWYALCYSW